MDFPRVSRDIYGDIMIQFMTAKELIEYCRLNKEFEGICKDPYTWKYLLYRDFGIISTVTIPSLSTWMSTITLSHDGLKDSRMNSDLFRR